MLVVSPHLVTPALRGSAQVISWAVRKSLSPPTPLTPIDIDIATEIQLEDSTGDFVVVEQRQFEEIQEFLADPTVIALVRLRFMQRVAPADALNYLGEIANLSTFQGLTQEWCNERSQTWAGLAEHIWIQIERCHELLLSRIRLSEALTEAVSDILVNRFFFGRFGSSTPPEHARLINELAHNQARQQQMTELLYDCDRKTHSAADDEFLILGLQEDRAKFDDLYVDRMLIDAGTGEEVLASRHLDIRQACPRVVVIGDPGVGKSTLTSWVKWKTVSDISVTPSPVMITLVSRYDLADAASTVLSAIKRHFQIDFLVECDDKLFAYLAATGWITLMVDGIDEIPDVDQRRRVVEQLNTIAETYPALPIVCTTRRTGFEVSLFRSPPFLILKLDSYSDEQVSEYAHKWFAGSPYLTGGPPIRPLRLAHPDPAGRTYGALAAAPLLATVRDPLRRGSLLPYRAARVENRGPVCRCRHSRAGFPHPPRAGAPSGFQPAFLFPCAPGR